MSAWRRGRVDLAVVFSVATAVMLAGLLAWAVVGSWHASPGSVPAMGICLAAGAAECRRH